MDAAAILEQDSQSAEVIDLRVLNPFSADPVIESVGRTGRLLVVDPGCMSAGFAAEIVTRVCETLPPGGLKRSPVRVTLPDAPAPTSRVLEQGYYIGARDVVDAALAMLSD